jgi:hypothetical protein
VTTEDTLVAEFLASGPVGESVPIARFEGQDWIMLGVKTLETPSPCAQVIH